MDNETTPTDPTDAELPPMTEGDMHAFVQRLSSLILMGVTRIEVHPARWRFLLDSMLRLGAYPADKLHWMEPREDTPEDYERVAVPVMLSTGDGLLTCMLMGRRIHADEGEYGPAIDAQAEHYPVPQDDPLHDARERAKKSGIILPERFN